MKSYYDLQYKGDLCLDLHLPEGDSFDLFVFFHGGGLTGGDRKEAEHFAATLAKRGIATASVEYRMYPNAKFPDFIEDAAYSVAWLREHIGSFGKCARLFVGGSSAGGYISMMLCFDKRYFEAVGLAPSDIDGYIHDAGQPTSHFRVLKEMGLDGRRVVVDETAPLYFVGAEPSYPPMLFIVSDDDMPGRYEQTVLTLNTLEQFGHKKKVFLTVEHGTHTEYIRRVDEDGENPFGKIVLSFLDKLA